jgi:hypothetical protein
VTVAREEEKLKLGKGAAFVKSRLKRLPQEDNAWEADFFPLPCADGKHETVSVDRSQDPGEYKA